MSQIDLSSQPATRKQIMIWVEKISNSKRWGSFISQFTTERLEAHVCVEKKRYDFCDISKLLRFILLSSDASRELPANYKELFFIAICLFFYFH